MRRTASPLAAPDSLDDPWARSRAAAMNDAEFAAEQAAIAREHAELRAEHARLEHEASDTPRFIEHARALRRHVNRQWALIAAWHARGRES